MPEGTEQTRVLILVMTYPHPSRGYNELVCTAGITAKGEWVRLYPVDYRYRPRQQRFRKYQWIEVELEASGVRNDQRKESRRPRLDSIKMIGEPLPTKEGWKARREIVDLLPTFTRNQLHALHDVDKTSLGLVKPSRVLDLEIREADPEWKPEWNQLYKQLRLFEEQPKPLRKIPYTFHYKFECSDSLGKSHTAMCEDWELGTLFLKESERLGSDLKAAESVKARFLGELCDASRDTKFFMGTHFPYNTWLVLGIYWPPVPIKNPQLGFAFD